MLGINLRNGNKLFSQVSNHDRGVHMSSPRCQCYDRGLDVVREDLILCDLTEVKQYGHMRNLVGTS